jgi:hypothetical protein
MRAEHRLVDADAIPATPRDATRIQSGETRALYIYDNNEYLFARVTVEYVPGTKLPSLSTPVRRKGLYLGPLEIRDSAYQ